MKNIEKHWIKKGTEFTLLEGKFDIVEKIDPGIYNIVCDDNGLHLVKFQEEFKFDFKIYGLQSEFIDYVLKTYKGTTGNLGVLLNGVKGTGKTVSAKVLANLLGLPVIIVKSLGNANDELIEFLGSFNFDCTLFFDEFEKQFKEDDNTVLQIMDGVYNNLESRKVFLLTTNKLIINNNLISRPSRVRYIKSFEHLEESVVREYLLDNLKEKDLVERVINYTKTLEDSTIDILKTIVSEINVHGIDSFLSHKNWFNASNLKFSYNCLGYIVDSNDINAFPGGLLGYIDAFKKDLETYTKSLSEDPRLSPEWMEMTKDQRQEKLKEFKGKLGYIIDFPEVDELRTTTPFYDLKVDDRDCHQDPILYIDKKENIVVLELEFSDIQFLKVLNPNESPIRNDENKYIRKNCL